MVCPCGKQFCFRCHDVPHWPLSCDALRQYHALLRRHGDLQTAPHSQLWVVEVKGKTCPRCRRFIEKDGGCLHMVCVCQHAFWWCCLQSRVHDPRCSQTDGNRNQHTWQTARRVIKHVDTSASRSSAFYDLAVQHRAYQHPKEVRLLGKRAEDVRRKLQVLSSRGVDIGVPPLPHVAATGPSMTAVTKPASTRPTTRGAKKQDPVTDEEDIRQDCQAAPAPDGNHNSLLTRPQTPRRRGALPGAESPPLASPAEDHARQHVKHATVAMTRLMVALHNVIEHTAALLNFYEEEEEGDPRGRDHDLSRVTLKKVKGELEHLVFLASSLDWLLDARSPRQLRHALPWFRCLQRGAKDAMTTLARLLNSRTRRE